MRSHETMAAKVGDITDTMVGDAGAIAQATGTAFGDDAVGAIMKKYDRDGNGTFDTSEVRQIVNDVQAQKVKNKQLKWFVGILFLLSTRNSPACPPSSTGKFKPQHPPFLRLVPAPAVIAMCVAMFGVSFAAGMALKESKVEGSTMTALNGDAMQVDTVESNVGLFDLPAVDTASLAKMKDVVFYADLTALASTGSWAEVTFKVAGVLKANNDVATIKTTSGEAVTVRRAAKTGELLMNGVSYPISDQCTGSCSAGRRKLATEVNVSPPAFNGKRKLGFFSALMTSGSFMMMQAGAF